MKITIKGTQAEVQTITATVMGLRQAFLAQEWGYKIQGCGPGVFERTLEGRPHVEVTVLRPTDRPYVVGDVVLFEGARWTIEVTQVSGSFDLVRFDGGDVVHRHGIPPIDLEHVL